MEIELTANQAKIEEEKNRIHKLLPFWARELLAMKDRAEDTHRVNVSSPK